MPAQPDTGTIVASLAVGTAALFLSIVVPLALVRWLFRVNLILDQLRAQTKILQDLRTQTWHTRRASETLAGIAADPGEHRP